MYFLPALPEIKDKKYPSARQYLHCFYFCRGIFIRSVFKETPDDNDFIGGKDWDYSRAKFNIKGVIRLDYAPLWFTAGLFFEKFLKKF